MSSAKPDTRGRTAYALGGQRLDFDDARASDAVRDAGSPFLAVKQSPGIWHDFHGKSRQVDTQAASIFAHMHVGGSERTPEPSVSIQLADDDGADSCKPARSRGANSIYRRVWGSGPSPILQRQFQRYSLRGKMTKNIGARDSVADSPVSRDTALPASFRPSHDTQPTDQSLRDSAPAGTSASSTTGTQDRTPCNGNGSKGRSAVSGGLTVHKSPGLYSSSCSPAPTTAARIPEPHASASPATATDSRTPEARVCASPVLPATNSRTPAGRRAASSAATAAVRTPETRIPRVAYLTPTAKRTAPGSAMAYRTTASSPGPNPLTPISAIRPSPNLGSGRKPLQHQPRGLAVLRYTAAASTSGSAAWPGISPARSEVVATPDPGMARTLDGLLLAEDIITELVARVVELAESGAHLGLQGSAEALPPRRLLKLAVVSEVERVDHDAASEGGNDATPRCRCVVM